MSAYVCHTPFKGKAICGPVDIKKGDVFTESAGVILDGIKQICLARSQNGIEHFAINDDGKGLERGMLTREIAFGDRRRTWTETCEYENEYGEKVTEEVEQEARFSPEEAELLTTQYSHWLRPGHSVILFNEDFFKASVEELRDFAQKINLDI